MHQNHNRKGFTLVELMFSMTFVAVLMILVLSATIQISRTYSKGISLKQVNQAGISIGDELTTALKQAQAPLTTGAQTSGRLCLGKYSYVWNLNGATDNKYMSDGAQSQDIPIGMVKVIDPGKQLCFNDSGLYPSVDKSQSSELLLVKSSNVSAVDLNLKALKITQLASSGVNYLYDVSYTISTSDSSLLTTTGDQCKGGADDEFCALNAFDLTVGVKGAL